jgi:hypothetical protein
MSADILWVFLNQIARINYRFDVYNSQLASNPGHLPYRMWQEQYFDRGFLAH